MSVIVILGHMHIKVFQVVQKTLVYEVTTAYSETILLLLKSSDNLTWLVLFGTWILI